MMIPVIYFIWLATVFQSDQFTAEVISIEAGDTIEVKYNNKNVRIRIFGIDCPEDGQAFSAKAKQLTMALCHNKAVKILKRSIDPQGRTVGDVILEDGRSVAKELLATGYAWHYKRFSNDEDLAKLEAEAKAKKKGLWIEDNAMAPWDYRKLQKEKKQ